MSFAPTPSQVLNDMIPIGGIINWSGSIASIPSNFQLCDGTNGTPDLNGLFVMGAGSFEAPGSTGGDPTHNHAPTATHQCPGSGGIGAWSASNSDDQSNIPPWYALAYIQRMT